MSAREAASEGEREKGREREAGRHWHVHIHTRRLDDPAEIEHLVALFFQKLHGHVRAPARPARLSSPLHSAPPAIS